MSIRKFLFATILGCVSLNASAGNKTLLPRIPASLTDAQIAEVVADAFRGRRWEVARSSPKLVEGRIEHKSYVCNVVMSWPENSLNYQDDCTKMKRAGGPGATKKRVEADAPDAWLNFLRQDIRAALSSRALSVMPPSSSGRGDVVNRLEKLEELLRKGLISDSEFKQKRTEILDDL